MGYIKWRVGVRPFYFAKIDRKCGRGTDRRTWQVQLLFFLYYYFTPFFLYFILFN